MLLDMSIAELNTLKECVFVAKRFYDQEYQTFSTGACRASKQRQQVAADAKAKSEKCQQLQSVIKTALMPIESNSIQKAVLG